MREAVFSVFATAVGAIIGSFLNACIHRMPRNIPLGNPKRSFCPSCNRTIPWHENLPIISWLLLRGKCSACGSRIPMRYFWVEVLTAGLFLGAWQLYGLPLAPIYWFFLSLLVAATFIDIEHFIIPDEITWGGTVAGIILCGIFPEMMQTDSRLHALGYSFLAALLGFGLLWLIVEFGKLAFGKKKHVLENPETFLWQRHGDTASITVGEETLTWDEIFYRPSDELVLVCPKAAIGDRQMENVVLRIRYDRLFLGEEVLNLDDLDTITGSVTTITIPREAMGFGDVKFIAAIGAFLGWKAVLFTIGAGSIIGCFAAVAGIFLARDKAGSRVPFGPFLALGAAIWVFGGEAIWNWYFGLLSGGDSQTMGF